MVGDHPTIETSDNSSCATVITNPYIVVSTVPVSNSSGETIISLYKYSPLVVVRLVVL